MEKWGEEVAQARVEVETDAPDAVGKTPPQRHCLDQCLDRLQRLNEVQGHAPITE